MGRLRINEHHWHWEGSLRVAEEAMSLLFILAMHEAARLRISHCKEQGLFTNPLSSHMRAYIVSLPPP